MNITFILGNGFDIQLGLNSRYSDFLEVYSQPSESDNENIRDFKTHLSEKQNKELWSYAEKAMGEHLGQFSDETLSSYNRRILDFEGNLFEYLEKEQNKCSFEKRKQIADTFIAFITKSFSDVLNRKASELNINKDGRNVFEFITFNYTNLIDQIITCCGGTNNEFRKRNNVYSDIFGSVHHVHGSLDTQIIMGVNDESQLDLSGGVTLTDRLKWQIIKPEQNHLSRNNWDAKPQKIIKDSDIIAIYGVSFGETDNLWWREIQKWLRQNPSRQLVAFVKDNENAFDKRIPWQEINYEYDKRVEILSTLGVSRNDTAFEKLINQVYIILNTQRLNLKKYLQAENHLGNSLTALAKEIESRSNSELQTV